MGSTKKERWWDRTGKGCGYITRRAKPRGQAKLIIRASRHDSSRAFVHHVGPADLTGHGSQEVPASLGYVLCDCHMHPIPGLHNCSLNPDSAQQQARRQHPYAKSGQNSWHVMLAWRTTDQPWRQPEDANQPGEHSQLRWHFSWLLLAYHCRGGCHSDCSVIGIGQVVVFAVSCFCNLFSKARGDKLVLCVDYQELQPGCIQLLGHVSHLVLCGARDTHSTSA